MLCATLQRPKSVGSVRLTTVDPHVQPHIDINLLDDPEDLAKMRDGVRRAWALLTSPEIAEVTAAILRPDAATVEDDGALEAYLRANVSHLVHPVGTCKMGPATDPMAVVDQHGRVHGVPGLRVADASIMPDLVRANTNLTAIMIGERVAALMR
jgi:choline dehydrogenase